MCSSIYIQILGYWGQTQLFSEYGIPSQRPKVQNDKIDRRNEIFQWLFTTNGERYTFRTTQQSTGNRKTRNDLCPRLSRNLKLQPTATEQYLRHTENSMAVCCQSLLIAQLYMFAQSDEQNKQQFSWTTIHQIYNVKYVNGVIIYK